MKRASWISLAILALALLFRLVLLDLKPAHFDEGVNGWFVDQMTRQGYYHYDPTNFHGPLHFYVIFIAQTLFGRHAWALRLPLALVSTGCVAMLLAYRAYLGERVCQIAALCMAVSPAFVFYGRYAIHESWLVLFLLITVWGLAGLCHFGTRRHLWAAGLGVAGMILTKETYIIHALALALGYATVRALEMYSPSAAFQPAAQQWSRRDLGKVAAASLALILFFYSGCLLDWSGVEGLWLSIAAWIHTGMHADTGHEKEPWYWLELLLHYEWPALLGLALSFVLVRPGSSRTLRWIAISGGGTLFAYSIIAYKTPWCLITMIWPFYFVLGHFVVWANQRLDRWIVAGVTAVLIGYSLVSSLLLNFRNYAREEEPYVYVQTREDVHKLLRPLQAAVARDRTNLHLTGYLAMTDLHPLPWLLADFTHVTIGALSELPEDLSN
ncbi:MAG TPA: flippase activity-associated protein Agl23, partial [Chthoniobacteraceae bacterium]